MKPRRTPASNTVFRLEGGTEDNDLWIERFLDDRGAVVLASVWELTEEERAAVAAGANVELLVWGPGTPPVALRTSDAQLGRGAGASDA